MASAQTNMLHSKSKNLGCPRGPKRKRPENVFGGIFFKNYNPSMQRPIMVNKALHLVLKSSQATGAKSFKSKKYEDKIFDIIKTHAQKNNITLYSHSNAGNHLHLLIRVKRRDDYQRFIRTITGLIARLVGQAKRGQKLKKKFWDSRPFSRIVSFAKKDFEKVKSYLTRNDLEAIGWMPYLDRSKRLPAKWKAFWKNTFSVPI